MSRGCELHRKVSTYLKHFLLDTKKNFEHSLQKPVKANTRSLLDVNCIAKVFPYRFSSNFTNSLLSKNNQPIKVKPLRLHKIFIELRDGRKNNLPSGRRITCCQDNPKPGLMPTWRKSYSFATANLQSEAFIWEYLDGCVGVLAAVSAAVSSPSPREKEKSTVK